MNNYPRLDSRISEQVKSRLIRDFNMRDAGQYLRGGKCPKCDKKELFANAESPRLIICGRKDKCGHEEEVRSLYPDIFEDCSTLTKDDPNPNAAADFYLGGVRGFDLQYLRGAYAQEFYQDRKLGIGSATVRFPLPNGSWWERLIDQAGRFPRKANFAPGSSYNGHAWTLPGRTIADYAAADQIWMVEGIFDAIALEQGDFRTARDPDHPIHLATAPADGSAKTPGAPVENILPASLMSCYNYPENFLRDLRIAIASGPTPTHTPLIVFALDLGAAGTEYTRKFIKQAREEGWPAAAAQVKLDDDPGAKLDWNDLLLRDRLGHANRARYRWAGDVLVAKDEREKAFLIWREKKWGSFSFVFESRTWWASFSDSAIDDRIAEGFASNPELSIADNQVKREFAAREVGRVEMIANCTFRALYYERNETTDSSAYWLRIDRPGNYEQVKASFPGPSMAGSGEFRKRLISVASGAIWTGEQFHLDRITLRQLPVRDVVGIEFTGYSRDHKAYVFGDIAVHAGRVYRLNDDGYFDIGKTAIKLRTAERILDSIEYDPEHYDTGWVDDVWTAWGPKGFVVVAFFVMSLFAEQLRKSQKTVGFLEATGAGGTGKTTLFEFCWKLLGRDAYEGFDPAKSTAAGISRELAKAANLPVVFIEGDRTDDVPHSKRYDWEETKTLYNGRATRTRGVKSEGLETYSPPFRGAFAIVQNAPITASRPVLERIMAVEFTKEDWSTVTLAAARRIGVWPVEKVSGLIIHIARREAQLLEEYYRRFDINEVDLASLDGAHDQRLILNHAQLMSIVDCLRMLLPISTDRIEATRKLIRQMTVERHQAVASDHPDVETFWERFYFIEGRQAPTCDQLINHSRDPEKTIAISLIELEARCADLRVPLPEINKLRKLLKSSKRHPFVATKTVNSANGGKSVQCWVFQRQPNSKN